MGGPAAPVAPCGGCVVSRALGANVSGSAAVWVLRRIEPDIAASVRHFRAIGREDIARELAATFADVREAARQYRESLDVSDPGTPEVAPPPDRACSDHVAMAVGTAAAAGALNCTDRRVRQLLTAGALAGHKLPGGAWAINPQDLERLQRDRPA